MKRGVGLLLTSMVGIWVGLAGCAETPAKICSSADTQDTARSIILEQASALLSGGEDPIEVSTPEMQKRLGFRLVTVESVNKDTNEVRCSGELTLQIKDSERSAFDTIASTQGFAASTENPVFSWFILRGQPKLPEPPEGLLSSGRRSAPINFGSQRQADGKDSVVSVWNVKPLASAVAMLAIAQAGLAQAPAEEGRMSTPLPDDPTEAAVSQADAAPAERLDVPPNSKSVKHAFGLYSEAIAAGGLTEAEQGSKRCYSGVETSKSLEALDECIAFDFLAGSAAEHDGAGGDYFTVQAAKGRWSRSATSLGLDPAALDHRVDSIAQQARQLR